MPKQTRSEVFAALQSNARYKSLHKGKQELEASLKHSRGQRLPPSVIRNLERAFDGIVKQLGSIEDAALKKAGYK